MVSKPKQINLIFFSLAFIIFHVSSKVLKGKREYRGGGGELLLSHVLLFRGDHKVLVQWIFSRDKAVHVFNTKLRRRAALIRHYHARASPKVENLRLLVSRCGGRKIRAWFLRQQKRGWLSAPNNFLFLRCVQILQNWKLCHQQHKIHKKL
jgi:hypothetical protein